MIREFKGTSEFALLADELPVRARVCLALFAAEIALHHLKSCISGRKPLSVGRDQ